MSEYDSVSEVLMCDLRFHFVDQFRGSQGSTDGTGTKAFFALPSASIISVPGTRSITGRVTIAIFTSGSGDDSDSNEDGEGDADVEYDDDINRLPLFCLGFCVRGKYGKAPIIRKCDGTTIGTLTKPC